MPKKIIQSDEHAKDVEEMVDGAVKVAENTDMANMISQFLGYIEKDAKKVESGNVELSKEYMAELAFMAEMVEIKLHESPEEFAEQVIPVHVNGLPCMFPRGTTVRCPRYFANGLIVRNDVITTPSVQVAGPDGSMEKSYGIKKRSSHKYPFEVIKDSGKGREWFQRRLAEVV